MQFFKYHLLKSLLITTNAASKCGEFVETELPIFWPENQRSNSKYDKKFYY